LGRGEGRKQFQNIGGAVKAGLNTGIEFAKSQFQDCRLRSRCQALQPFSKAALIRFQAPRDHLILKVHVESVELLSFDGMRERWASGRYAGAA
jgi:hypothetical protein